MAEKKLTRIGLDIDDEVLTATKEIAEREGWSLRQVALNALKTYIKMREHRKEEA